MNRVAFGSLAAIFMAAMLAGGCASGIGTGKVFGKDSVELLFLINETGEPLDGVVSLNGNFLGNATGGTLKVNRGLLSSGGLSLEVTDPRTGNAFSLKFDFLGSDAMFDLIRFEVPLSSYMREIFDASALEADSIEAEIFRLANIERVQRGVKPLRWNERIAEVARDYSASIPESGFHHTDLTGRGVKQRLSDAGIIFIVANENLYFSGSITEETDLAKAAIGGWLGSPGHRATLLDRDGLYSDAGVGVHCERKDCYVVMNFAALKQEQEVSLKRGWVTFQYLHNPDYGFAADEIAVRLGLSSSAPVNVFVVADKSEYERFISGARPEALSKFEGIVSVDERFLVGRGHGIIIESPERDAVVRLALDFS